MNIWDMTRRIDNLTSENANIKAELERCDYLQQKEYDENADLRHRLAIAVDMASENAKRIDALVAVIEGMDASAITGDASLGTVIVQYDDYNLLIELAQSMQKGTQVSPVTLLSVEDA